MGLIEVSGNSQVDELDCVRVVKVEVEQTS